MDWIQVVSELGFPMAISIYLVIRIEKQLIDLKDSIDHLSEQIKKD